MTPPRPKTTFLVEGAAVAAVALACTACAAYVVFLVYPAPTTFNVTVETERIEYVTRNEMASRIALDSVEVVTDAMSPVSDPMSPFSGAFQVGDSASVVVERVGRGGLLIQVEAYETGRAGRFFDEYGEPTGEAGPYVEFFLHDPGERAERGQNVIIPIAGRVSLGRNVGFETGATTAILRSGEVTMLGRSILWWFSDEVYEAGSVDLDLGDTFIVDAPASEAVGFAVINERPALSAAYRVNGRRAQIIRPGPAASGYPVSISFLDRLLNDRFFRAWSVLLGGLVTLATIASFVIGWRGRRRSLAVDEGDTSRTTDREGATEGELVPEGGSLSEEMEAQDREGAEEADPEGGEKGGSLARAGAPEQNTKNTENSESMRTVLLIFVFASAGLGALSTPVAAQDPVYVRAGSDEGRGVLRARQNECFVVVPHHVVENAFEATVTDAAGASWPTTDRTNFEGDDIAVLRVEGLADCDQWPDLEGFDEMVREYLSGFLEVQDAFGSSRVPVDFRYQDAEFIVVEPSDPDDAIVPTYSGSPLYVNLEGRRAFAGLLLRLDSLDQTQGVVLQADDLARVIDPVFPIAAPTLDAATAQSMLDRALVNRDGSMQGQVEAVEALVARGYTFENADLSGISLEGADLRGGTFDDALMHAVDLSEAEARGVGMARSDLRFARLEGGDFQKADLAGVYAPFVWGRGEATDFEGGDLSSASFFGADFRSANFSNADLRGTALAFADLRGAKFDGADLTGAYLAGSILDGASFEGAKIDNTEFTGAVGDGVALTREQKRGACRHEPDLDGGVDERLEWWVELIELWESDRFSSGTEAEHIMNSRWLLSGFAERSLPLCTSEVDTPPYYNAQYPATERIHLQRDYLARARRRRVLQERVQQQLDLLKEHEGRAPVVRDEGVARERAAAVESAFRAARSPDRPYFDGDIMLPVLLNRGVLHPDSLDWEALAKSRYDFEQDRRDRWAREPGGFAQRSMWPDVFPESIPYPALPDNAVDLFKDWTLHRASRVPDQLISTVAWSDGLLESESPTAGYLSSGTSDAPPRLRPSVMPYGIRGRQPYSEALKEAVEARGIDTEQTRVTLGIPRSPIRRIIYVAPRDPSDHVYVAQPSPDITDRLKRGEEGDGVEIDLAIDGTERLPLDGYSALIVYLAPGQVRIVDDGDVVWRGELQVAPPR